MPGRTVSRRMVVGMLGSGVALAPSFADAIAGPAKEAVGHTLLAPLRPGDTIAGFTVTAISPIEEGAVTAVCSDGKGHRFMLEILARDASPLAPRPPAETSRFAVHVRNGGDGWAPTIEEQGLTAMALAKIIAANEGNVSVTGFLTHAERFAKHRDLLEQKIAPKRRGL